VSDVTRSAKRFLIGKPLATDRLGETLLSKKVALPVFASDALSSVAYATEEILLVLSAGGIAFLSWTGWVALAVAMLMFVVVASYRQNVHAYPSGGGDYEVATTNLGPPVGVVVASALMCDYVLTVAVSVAAGVANLASAFPALTRHSVLTAVLVVVVVAVLNLRGVREAGAAFAVPTYFFVASVALLIVVGLVKLATGSPVQAESAHYGIATHGSVAGLGAVFLLLRAFSSGCTALTGVEAISNGVPAFKKPKSRNAATTLALLGGIAVTLFAGVTALALASRVHYAADPADLIGAAAGHEQRTVIAQVARAVFGGDSPLFFILQFVTALILVLAANTAFNGFPVLASILAEDSYLPRQLHTRGDRLAYSNGIVLLSGAAIVLIIAFRASPTRLIQLYILGVFVSFVCSQTGMVRHWNRRLRQHGPGAPDAAARRRMRRSRAVNFIGATFTAVVLIIVVVTKFLHGAWIVAVAIPLLWLTMQAIHRHYGHVRDELVPPADRTGLVLPSQNTAIVLVSKLHLPTLRAMAYAKTMHPHRLIALTVDVNEDDTQQLQHQWDERGIPVPLTVLNSPYREVTRPVLAYVAELRREAPDDIVTVFIPEYVVGHWWEQVLHNQSALRLKGRLLFEPGVIVASVPWQLKSSVGRAVRTEHVRSGQIRGPRRHPGRGPGAGMRATAAADAAVHGAAADAAVHGAAADAAVHGAAADAAVHGAAADAAGHDPLLSPPPPPAPAPETQPPVQEQTQT